MAQPEQARESTTAVRTNDATSVARVDMKLEVIVISVSDVNRAKEFYQSLGWRLDATPPGVVQFTPPAPGVRSNSAGIARRLSQGPRRVCG